MMPHSPLQSLHPNAEHMGLTDHEVQERRARGEGNEYAAPTSRTYRQIARAHLFNALNGILFSLSIALIVFGRPSDALLTGGIVLINGIIGIVQEVRAKHQLDHIALLSRPRVTVIRAGQEQTVDPGEIVRGDLIVARPGDQLIADGQIIGSGQMEVNEALLTGEADSIRKTAGDAVLSGSFCTAGTAHYIAERVGTESFANQLTASARSFRQPRTPLQREVDVLVRLLVLVVACGELLYGIVTQLSNDPLVDRIKGAAVIAGLVPNGLILMVTLAYVLGIVRLAESNMLIQQTNAVESLAHVDVLCLDKTGTLTTSRLTVHAVHAIAMPEADFSRLLGEYAASSTAGNATSDALVRDLGGQARPIKTEIPFNSARKWSALTFEGETLVFGAPEMVLPVGTTYGVPMTDWLAQGLRVLILVRVLHNAPLVHGEGEPHLPATLDILGFVSLRDELRPEAAATLRAFADAGVQVKVISGDHPGTVTALALQAGLGPNLRSISGLELDALDDEQLGQVATDTTVFGRITPPQKARLVGALQAQGHYVAMTGDGVNDVLSLKRANLGIAMAGGSAAARGVADIVLLGDSFAALPRAFGEGQRILNGMRDVLALYISRLTYVALTIVAVALVVDQFPYTPANRALITTLTMGIPTFALVACARPGAQASRGLLRSLSSFFVPAALTLALLATGIYAGFFIHLVPSRLVGISDAVGSSAARQTAYSALTTAMVLSGLVLLLLMPTLTHGPRERGGTEGIRLILLALVMLGVYALVLALPAVREFFELSVLTGGQYAVIVAAVVAWACLFWGMCRARLLERYLGGIPNTYQEVAAVPVSPR